jgi:hypothetical protein
MNDKNHEIFSNYKIEDAGIYIGPIEFWHGLGRCKRS